LPSITSILRGLNLALYTKPNVPLNKAKKINKKIFFIYSKIF
jgi:hypothetical protein